MEIHLLYVYLCKITNKQTNQLVYINHNCWNSKMYSTQHLHLLCCWRQK